MRDRTSSIVLRVIFNGCFENFPFQVRISVANDLLFGIAIRFKYVKSCEFKVEVILLLFSLFYYYSVARFSERKSHSIWPNSK